MRQRREPVGEVSKVTLDLVVRASLMVAYHREQTDNWLREIDRLCQAPGMEPHIGAELARRVRSAIENPALTFSIEGAPHQRATTPDGGKTWKREVAQSPDGPWYEVPDVSIPVHALADVSKLLLAAGAPRPRLAVLEPKAPKKHRGRGRPPRFQPDGE